MSELWPLHPINEMRVLRERSDDPVILPSDIAEAGYSYPPGSRERYTASGWEKAKVLGIAVLDVRDFGAVPVSADGIDTK